MAGEGCAAGFSLMALVRTPRPPYGCAQASSRALPLPPPAAAGCARLVAPRGHHMLRVVPCRRFAARRDLLLALTWAGVTLWRTRCEAACPACPPAAPRAQPPACPACLPPLAVWGCLLALASLALPVASLSALSGASERGVPLQPALTMLPAFLQHRQRHAYHRQGHNPQPALPALVWLADRRERLLPGKGFCLFLVPWFFFVFFSSRQVCPACAFPTQPCTCPRLRGLR